MDGKNFVVYSMPFLLIGLVIGASFDFITGGGAGIPSDWFAVDWLYRYNITIECNYIDSDLVNFPVLINITSSNFTDAQGDGDDFVFYNSSGVKLNHEIEYFSGNNLVCWVNLTELSSVTDSYIHLYFGNASAVNQENIVGTWNSNYTLIHHLTGANFGDLDDSTGCNNDVNNEGGTPDYNSNGIVAKCVGLDVTSSENLYIPNDVSITFTDCSNNDLPLTFEVWFRPDSFTESCGLFSKYNTGNGEYYVQCVSSRCLRLVLYDVGANSAIRRESNEYLSTNYWYCFSMSYDGSETANNMNLYVNGSLSNGAIDDGALYNGMDCKTKDFEIGGYKDGANSFDGLIDECRISNVVRSAGWLKTSYNTVFYGFDGGFFTVGGLESI